MTIARIVLIKSTSKRCFSFNTFVVDGTEQRTEGLISGYRLRDGNQRALLDRRYRSRSFRRITPEGFSP